MLGMVSACLLYLALGLQYIVLIVPAVIGINCAASLIGKGW